MRHITIAVLVMLAVSCGERPLGPKRAQACLDACKVFDQNALADSWIFNGENVCRCWTDWTEK